MAEESRMALLKDAMVGQWRSMGSMAGMFVGTILLAIYIQPFWDRPESRAFGEAGTTKVGLIGLEFILILIFTGVIIWLAKKGLQIIIKWAVLIILWISLSYCLIPLSSYALDIPEPTVVFRDEATLDGEFLFVDIEPSTFLVDNHTHLIKMGNASGIDSGQASSEIWSWSLDMGNQSYSAHPKRIVDNIDSYLFCDQARWVKLGKSDGNIISSYNESCNAGFSTSENDWAIKDNYLYRIDPFHSGENIVTHSWWYSLPESFVGAEFLRGVLLNDDNFLLVSSGWAGIIEIPDSQHTGELNDVNATILWQIAPSSGDSFTTSAWGHSPWDGNVWWSENSTDRLLMIGTELGGLHGYVWDGVELTVEEHIKFNERDAFDSAIQGIMLADDQRDGRTDLWIASGGETRIFSGSAMVESLTIEGPEDDGPIGMVLHTVDAPRWAELGIEDGVLTSYSNNTAQSAVVATPVNDPAYVLQDSAGYWIPIYWSQIIAMIVATVLMVVLTIRPEWYVVNTTGILTGAGVITIIGVSFVPTLILIFMVITAIYDWYAVYKSKHMLDLADTMISLKLPILLVAPQDNQYSFLDEGTDTMSRMEEEPVAQSESRQKDDSKGKAEATPPPPRPKKQGGDALFMGLGDVIFPGMLVVSALTFLSGDGTILGLSDPMFVALGTLLGGLLGYTVLMSYVAMGRPQAGLPLLNGGSILGYLLSGFIAVGTAAISFGITIF
ncbi:MAG: presenilin family intramembrane aspartyl protease PSH [Candidatus Thalassarchaeaceae archaeon]|jgi:presenilin-like A22 family membrane protease|nr:presenilin family intramembrane aspartyl protease PSH [Candidatus Thalassarchaeaceae archaeon]